MKSLYYSSLYSLLIILLSSCNLLDFLKDEPDKDKDENKIIVSDITEDNFEEVILAIENRLDALIGSDINTVSEVIPYIESIENEEWVENVELEDEAVFIKVKDGGYIALTESSFKEDDDELGTRSSVRFSADEIVENIKNQINTYGTIATSCPRYVEDSVFYVDTCHDSGLESVVGNTEPSENFISMIGQKHTLNKVASNQTNLEGCKNRKVLFADVSDGEFTDLTNIIHNTKTIFENWYGVFDVDYKKGTEVTMEFLEDHLTDYGLIFLISHGLAFDDLNKTYIQTGSLLSDSLRDRVAKWKNNENLMIIPLQGKGAWGIGPDFFKILHGSFEENSILVGFICNTFNYDDKIWRNLESKNLGAFIGYKGPAKVRYADEAFNSIVRLLINPANSEILNPSFSSEVSIKESFDYFNNSPHFWGGWGVDEMILKTKKDNIALFSTISEEDEVNLGYPSFFASRNIGATAIQNCGSSYNLFREDKYLIDGFVSGSSFDPATKLLGEAWSIPTSIDFGCLLQSHITNDFNYNGVIGTRFTGVSGESIFIPDDYLQCGDHGMSAEYNYQKDNWNQQEQTSYFIMKNGSGVWELLEVENPYFYDYMVYPLIKEVFIFSTLKRQSILNSSIRPVRRNVHPLYKEIWKQIDATTDKQLKKVKLITVDDIVTAVKYHYPDYTIY